MDLLIGFVAYWCLFVFWDLVIACWQLGVLLVVIGYCLIGGVLGMFGGLFDLPLNCVGWYDG